MMMIKEQYTCVICEKERDPSLWYYYCSICDNSANTKCVFGEYLFVQDGSTWPYDEHNHSHDLKFYGKTEGYPDYSVCGRLCLGESFKCAESTCNKIVHLKCMPFI